jgi:hypothetical protein
VRIYLLKKVVCLLARPIGKRLHIYAGFGFGNKILAHSLTNVEMTSIHIMKISNGCKFSCLEWMGQYITKGKIIRWWAACFVCWYLPPRLLLHCWYHWNALDEYGCIKIILQFLSLWLRTYWPLKKIIQKYSKIF